MLDVAAEALIDWYMTSSLEALSERVDERVANARELQSQIIAFLEHPQGMTSPRNDELYKLLNDVRRALKAADHTIGESAYARIKQRREGTFAENGRYIEILKRINQADRDNGYPVDDLPPETVMRMHIRGWAETYKLKVEHNEIVRGTGIDDGLLWDVTGAPFTRYLKEPYVLAGALAAAVQPAGGWAFVGAEKCLYDLFSSATEDIPVFSGLLDAAVIYMHHEHVPVHAMAPYEYWRLAELQKQGKVV